MDNFSPQTGFSKAAAAMSPSNGHRNLHIGEVSIACSKALTTSACPKCDAKNIGDCDNAGNMKILTALALQFAPALSKAATIEVRPDTVAG